MVRQIEPGTLVPAVADLAEAGSVEAVTPARALRVVVLGRALSERDRGAPH